MSVQRRIRDAFGELDPARKARSRVCRGMIVPLLYASVGVTSTIVDVGFFWMMAVGLSLSPILSNVISFNAGALNSFLLNSRFTFDGHASAGAYACKALRFAIVTVLMLLLSTASVAFLVHYLPVMTAKIAGSVLTLIVGFALNKRFVFR